MDFFGLNDEESDSDENQQNDEAKFTENDVLTCAYELNRVNYGPEKPAFDGKKNETRKRRRIVECNDMDERHRRIIKVRSSSECESGAKRNILTGHSKCVTRVQWMKQFLLSSSMDGSLIIWDPFEAKQLHQLRPHKEAVRDSAWNEDVNLVLSGGFDKFVRVTDLNCNKEILAFQQEGLVSAVAWHPANRNLFLSGSYKNIQAYDIRSSRHPLKTYSSNCGQILDVLFFENGSQFVCSSDVVSHDSADRTIIAWDFESTAILSNQIYQERYTCPHLCLHPSGQQFVAQTNGDYIAEFSTRRPYKMNKKRRFQGHTVSGYNVGCDFSIDGRFLYSGSADGALYCYDFHRGILKRRSNIFPRDSIISVSCHPTSKDTLAVSSWNGKIQIIKLNQGVI